MRIASDETEKNVRFKYYYLFSKTIYVYAGVLGIFASLRAQNWQINIFW